MDSEKNKVVIKLAGEQIPFIVDSDEEPYFREANEFLNNRLAALTREHSAHANSQKLVSVLAVEAMVDALKINHRYQLLKEEVKGRIEIIQERFDDL